VWVSVCVCELTKAWAVYVLVCVLLILQIKGIFWQKTARLMYLFCFQFLLIAIEQNQLVEMKLGPVSQNILRL
jgi:hypothetical protein